MREEEERKERREIELPGIEERKRREEKGD